MNRWLTWLTALLTPLVLLFFILRLMLTPVFVEVEYRTPWFPPDPYGFTRSDRLHWSRYALTYLSENAPQDYLGDLRFPDGTPLFNERELQHMEDVQNVVRGGLRSGLFATLGLLGLGVLAWRTRRGAAFIRGLQRGGALTLSLVLFSATFGAISFFQFFTVFHRLFFEGDSWLFEYSDTLIRLFPLRFWQDAFAVVGLFLVLAGLALWRGLKPGSVLRV